MGARKPGAAAIDARRAIEEYQDHLAPRLDVYEQAVCDMVDRTSTAVAPWTLVEANNKEYARVKVLKTMCDAISD